VNAHTHVAGAIFRGQLEDRPNNFYGYALPMEQHLDADAIHVLSRLGIAELLLSGCTTMNDMFHHAAETARAAPAGQPRPQAGPGRTRRGAGRGPRDQPPADEPAQPPGLVNRGTRAAAFTLRP
jgi:5-methylthioadenosine/S-adenosylhomocysteine deaminase